MGFHEGDVTFNCTKNANPYTGRSPPELYYMICFDICEPHG